MLLAMAGVGLVVWLAPAMLPWLLLVLIGPVAAIPFSLALASNTLGAKSRKNGWFVVPEEIRPPRELQQMLAPSELSASRFPAIIEQAADFGLLQAVVDPFVNAIHVSLLRERSRPRLRTREYLTSLRNRLLRGGPHALTPAEKRTLMWDADAMLSAHRKLWGSPALMVHGWWRTAFQIYNQSSQRKFSAEFAPFPIVTKQEVAVK